MTEKDRDILEGPEAYERFEKLARGVVQVPKEEIDQDEALAKAQEIWDAVDEGITPEEKQRRNYRRSHPSVPRVPGGDEAT